MDAISIQNVTKHFRKHTIRREYTTLKSELVNFLKGKKRDETVGQLQVLKGINLTIPRGKTVGIIGRNGSGKSTLLKLITGIYTPSSGKIDVNGRISALLELGAGFHPDFSGRENILINGIIVGMSRAEIKRRMKDIIEFSELGDFIDEPVRNYSSGMFMRLAFSVAMHVSPDILIVDEILAVGDDHFRRKSMAKMNEFKQSGNTIVLVTHDLGSVSNWCDYAVWIDKGIIREQGDPAEVVREYMKDVHAEEERASAAAAQAEPPLTLASSGAASKRSTAGQVTLSPVRLFSSKGEPISYFDATEPMNVEVDFARERLEGAVTFSVAITRKDGLKVYELSTPASPALYPQEMLAGTVRLEVTRTGLAAGEYLLEVRAETRAEGQEAATARVETTFTVSSSVQTSGLVLPEHRWEGREAGAEQPKRVLQARSG